MQNVLKTELVNMLELEALGFQYPEVIILALEAAQNELCLDTGFEPCVVFNMGQYLLQTVVINNNPIINNNQADLVKNALLAHMAQNRIPGRIVTFNYRSGDRMVETSTFEHCNLNVGSCTVPCFSSATLYLDNHSVLTILFARVILE